MALTPWGACSRSRRALRLESRCPYKGGGDTSETYGTGRRRNNAPGQAKFRKE
jgi:hypothetical protein